MKIITRNQRFMRMRHKYLMRLPTHSLAWCSECTWMKTQALERATA